MSKKQISKVQPEPDLTPLAEALLRDMATNRTLIRYHTNVLGGSFEEKDIAALDLAYALLASLALIESAGAVVSFFGQPKRLYRVTDKGVERAKGLAA